VGVKPNVIVSIVRVSDAELSSGDDFCTVWHFLNRIAEGAAGRQPQYGYSS
jgi:hypothetical protein